MLRRREVLLTNKKCESVHRWVDEVLSVPRKIRVQESYAQKRPKMQKIYKTSMFSEGCLYMREHSQKCRAAKCKI
jgi:hypothetical protein